MEHSPTARVFNRRREEENRGANEYVVKTAWLRLGSAVQANINIGMQLDHTRIQ